MDPMILSVLYVWCQLNSEVIVNFWFGTRFKALYLPWILLGFNMILSGGGMLEIIGIIVGHVYYVLKFKFPEEQHGFSFLQTPAILKHWFPDQSSGVHGFGYSPRAPPANPNRGIFRGHNWGTGHVLRGNWIVNFDVYLFKYIYPAPANNFHQDLVTRRSKSL